MATPVGFLGFGEAARSFCGDPRWQGVASGYDIKLTETECADEKSSELERYDVAQCDEVSTFANRADLVLSVVTADQAFAAAKSAADHLRSGTLFLGMNSVSPSTKSEIGELLGKRDVDYVDVAIMAPVNPKQLDIPLLISGPKAKLAENKLRALGFAKTRIVGDQLGRASSIKMLRSVMIKGIEALTAECALAADRAGVTEEVFGSMGEEWLAKVDYNLNRMMVHGERRAAEMSEVVKTLESLGVEPAMSEGTVMRQLEIGVLGLKMPPENLRQKLKAIQAHTKEAAE